MTDYAVSSMVIDSMVYKFDPAGILRTGEIINTGDNDWWTSLIRMGRDQASKLSNQFLIIFNDGQPTILPVEEKDEATVGNTLGLPGYKISSADSAGVRNLLIQYPSFRDALNRINTQAKDIWEKSHEFTPTILIKQLDGEQVLVIEIPGDDPESDAERLWSLVSWRSKNDPHSIALLPLVITAGYAG